MAKTANIKILTLNCWGVFTPLACQYRNERIAEIGQELSKGEYDIVLLQEIWTQADYEKLSLNITPVLPYTHYFHSGMFGTGVCIFSKHPITETFQHIYTLNGYAHKVYHGDWLGGKGVGLAKIAFQDLLINVYGTHIHAQYDERKDEYLAHRVAQAYEMSQFIKLTSSQCDLVIVAGDLNLQPKDLGYKIITSNACLQDAWLSQISKQCDETGATCDRPDNLFHSKHTLTYAPQGLRLDYILYRGSKGHAVQCEKCILTLRQVPDKPFPYSDHEGVAADFTITQDPTAPGPKCESGLVEQHFGEALSLLDDGMKKVRGDQVFFVAALFMCITLLTVTADMTLPYGFGFLLVLLRIIITIAIGYFFWICIVLSNWELNGLIATKKDINNLLKANPGSIGKV